MTDFATTDPATDAMPLAPGVAQFYVVPWSLRTVRHDAGETTLVECRYFDERWNRIDHQPTRGDDAFIQLTQRATTKQGEKPPRELDLTLMSAVAKPADAAKARHPPADLNHSFIASGNPGATSLIVPVLVDPTRDVVLVFRSPADGEKIDYLVATSKPEIRNGSSCDD